MRIKFFTDKKESFKFKGRLLPPRPKQGQKQNRGRRAKSECVLPHYQKTKIQGGSRSLRLYLWLFFPILLLICLYLVNFYLFIIIIDFNLINIILLISILS
jgi:hypothetical protein